jgi:hypothetical protein
MENRENGGDSPEKNNQSENLEEGIKKAEEMEAELKEEGARQVEEVEKEGTEADIEEMRGVVSEIAQEAKEAKEAYIEESKEEKKRKIELLKNFFDKNSAKVEKITEDLCRKLGKVIDSDAVILELTNLLKDEAILGELEEEGIITGDMYEMAVILAPVIENAIRTVEEGGEEMSVAEKAKRVIVEILSETDAAKDPERIAAAGKMLILLSESGKISDPRVCAVLKAAGMALQYEIVQKKISKEFREWLKKEKEKQGGKNEEKIAEEIIEEAGY